MPRHIARHPQGVLHSTAEGITSLAGATVPTDGTAGYVTGCSFLKTDGTASTARYVNVGSATSCNFDIAATRSQPITDSSGGTASGIIAATSSYYNISFPVTLAQITGAGDVVTSWVPGHRFAIISFSAFVVEAVTTAAKAVTLNFEIGTTNLTGGALALTSANCTPLGAIVNASAITAANSGSASAAVSMEAASVTAFSEGAVVVVVTMMNYDLADALANIVT